MTFVHAEAVPVDPIAPSRRHRWPVTAVATGVAVTALVLGFLTPATAHPAGTRPASAHPATKTMTKHAATPAATAGTFRSVPVVRLTTNLVIAARGTVTVTVTGHGIPTDAGAVLLNLTDSAAAAAYLTAWPTGGTRPPTTNLNAPAGEYASNSAVVRVGTGGAVDLYNGSSGAASVDVDVSGYYVGGSVSTPGGFVPLPAARILDTRSGVGAASGPVAAHQTLVLNVAGHGGVPSSGVSAVAITLAAISATAVGTVPVWAYGSATAVSQLSFYPGWPVAGLILVPLGSGGRLVLTNQSSGTIGLTADVAGYFRAGTPTALGAYRAVDAFRLLDTTWHDSPSAQAIPGHGHVTISVSQRAGLDLFDVTAVALHITAYHTVETGSLSIGASDQPTPPPAVTFDPGHASRNTVLTPLSGSGGLTIVNSGDQPVDVLVDFNGTAINPRPSWHAGAEIAPPYGAPESISCPTATFCAAVDELGSARTYNGTTWSGPVPLGLDVTDPELLRVSCWAAGACIALGHDGRTLALSGGQWTDLGVGFHPAEFFSLSGLSCTSASFCVAAFPYTGVKVFNGDSWGALGLTGVDQRPGFGANTVDCVSASFCLSLGTNDTVSRWTGSAWTSAGTVDMPNGTDVVTCPSASFCLVGNGAGQTVTWNGTSFGARQTGPSAGFYLLRCTSATFCAAVTANPSFGLAAMTYNGTTWTTPIALATTDLINDLSCGAASNCHAITFGGSEYRLSAGTWSPALAFDVYGSAITGLSCPTTTFCVATELGGQVLTMSGATWTGPTRLSGSDTVRGVSCATPTFCVALGSDDFYRWNGTTWSPQHVANAAQAGSSISCPTTTFCLAVGLHTEVYNGTTWTAGTIPATGIGVSCASATFCAALVGTYLNPEPDLRKGTKTRAAAPAFVDEQAATFDGTTWSAPVTIKNFTWAQSISCPAVAFCVSVGLDHDGSGNIVSTTLRGAVWGPLRVLGPGADVDFNPSNLSCRGTGFCLASYAEVRGVATAATTNIVAWTTFTSVGPAPLTVSCASTTFCVGVSGRGRAYTWS